jgi:type II secretory pathway predicted ATPase ExeA
MYTAYFGLKEKPFSIAPDPQYLFMSDRHREALAHLTYGLGDAGGFVLLTGEVGTGKTTVSRCLMERLPENTQAAFILNPTLSNHELLATICDELKIRYRKTGATLKTLTDKIQEKLLKNHKASINTLLIIDEAQHLKPEVLEQLRLLTNLETNTKKLLQVILIGQPELQTLLKRRDLRQLAQRITARYHLLPLNKEEVAQYIKHRLSIAEGIRGLFSQSAMNTLYKICGGIPRLINLVCERSLINAYNSNVAVVNKHIVILSAKEALGEDLHLTPWWKTKWVKAICVFLLVCGVPIAAYMIGLYSLKEGGSKLNILSDKVNNVIKEEVTQIHSETKNDSKTDLEEVTKLKEDMSQEAEPITEALKPKHIEAKTHSNILENKQVIEQLFSKKSAGHQDKLEPKVVEVKKVEGVSDELLHQFNNALKENVNNNESVISDSDLDGSYSNNNHLEPIEKMPLWLQNGIPELQFEQHIYASDGQGWVKVNGRDRYEGDTIARELTLVEILPQKVVLNFRGEKFTMQALTSW